MESSVFIESFEKAGLTRDQAALYEALLRKGSLTARAAALEAKIGRTLGYAVLDQLIEQGLVEKRDSAGAVSRFFPLHPATLQEKVEAQQKTSERAAIALKAILPDLSSIYNLSTGRPGVRFYEGLEGIKQVLDDSLTSKTEIYSYVDIAAVEKFMPDLSREFAKSRQRLGIKKKNIGIDTPENRAEIEGYYTDVTEERLIKSLVTSFGTVMQIYDGRISYFTLGVEPLIGVIITDKHIYEMHKTLFEFAWNSPSAYSPSKNTQALSNVSV